MGTLGKERVLKVPRGRSGVGYILTRRNQRQHQLVLFRANVKIMVNYRAGMTRDGRNDIPCSFPCIFN